MRHAPWCAAYAHTSRNTSGAIVVPVGLEGDVIITARVRSLQYCRTSG